MNKKRIGFFFIYIALFICILSLIAYAAETSKLSDLFDSFQIFNIAETYAKYPYIVDSIIYFIFFISVAQVTLGKQFEGRGGKGVVIAVGLALAIATSYWASKSQFTIGRLGSLGMFIFAIVIGIKIYRLLKGNEKMGSAIWISIIIMYLAFYMYFPEIIKSFQEGGSYSRLFLGLLNLLFIVAIPMALMSIFRKGSIGGTAEDTEFGGLLPGVGEGRDGALRNLWNRTPWSHEGRERRARNREREDLDRERQAVQRITGIVNQTENFWRGIEGVLRRGGININWIDYAYSFIDTNNPAGLNPAQQAFLSNPVNRALLVDFRTQYQTAWTQLYNELVNINNMNAGLQARVIQQLSRPL